jgi:hypothetical protein
MCGPKAGPNGPVTFSATAKRPVGGSESRGADPDRNRSHHPSVSQDVQLSLREGGPQRPADRLDRHVAAELDPTVVSVRERFRRHLHPATANADHAQDQRAAEWPARPDAHNRTSTRARAEDDGAVQRPPGQRRGRPRAGAAICDAAMVAAARSAIRALQPGCEIGRLLEAFVPVTGGPTRRGVEAGERGQDERGRRAQTTRRPEPFGLSRAMGSATVSSRARFSPRRFSSTGRSSSTS